MSARARISLTSLSGLEGDSTKNKRVLPFTAARHSAGSVGETKLVSTPNRPRMFWNNCTVEPNMEREATT